VKNNSFTCYRPSSGFAYFSLYSKGIYRWQVKPLIQFILILLVSKAFFFGALFLIPITNAADSPALDAKNLIRLTNSERAINGLPELAVNEKLAQAAEKKADDIIARGYFAHTSPEGKPFYQLVREKNYSYKSAGENLAISFISNQDTMYGWMNSKTHRENILDSHFTEIGIAVSVGNFNGKTTAVAVQMFGEPSQAEAILTGTTLGVATQYHNEQNARASQTIDTLNFLNNSVSAALIILFALFIVLTLKDFAFYRHLIFKSTNALSFPAESAIPQ
jgi:hypothetical protein